jgi:isoleucyl-tRNA synthetase
MKGFRVDRVWGWDCHGVPIENMIEKELALEVGKRELRHMASATSTMHAGVRFCGSIKSGNAS